MKKRFVSDVILNTLASIVPIFILQFLILPRVAATNTSAEYGKIIATISILQLFSTTFGSALNNIRLIHNKKYEERKLQGDFNRILFYMIIINSIIILLSLIFYFKNVELKCIDYILYTLIAISMLTYTYSVVQFRISLNFKKVLIDSVIHSLGYALGYLTYKYTGEWVYIYISGYTVSLIYIFFNTKILKESCQKTIYYYDTRREVVLLIISGFIITLTTYIDKLLIYPLMGAEVLSVYYASTLLGKTISLAILPASGVLLSYLSNYSKFSKKNFAMMLSVTSGLGIFGFFVVIAMSNTVLNYLYPMFVEESIRLVPITTASIILTIISGFINTILLKFMSAKYQISINFVYIIAYTSLAITLQSMYGVYGFAVGIFIASLLKLVIMILIYIYKYNENQSEEKI